MAKKKFYAVAVGRRSGIFTDWPTAEVQVKGYPGAKYKSFASEDEARDWLAAPEYRKSPDKARTAPQMTESPRETSSEADGIVVYTDGGCLDNPGPGGYGIVIEQGGDRSEISGGFRLTTNNRMELMAAIVALEEVRGANRPVHLYSDSSYLVNGIEKGWAKKWRTNGWKKADGTAAMNIDLWQRLLDLLAELEVTFHWVKGHAGHEGNERCDRLAVAEARRDHLPPDRQYEAILQEGAVR